MAAQPVVVGTDGTRFARQAVTWAAQEAARRGVSLRIVSVWSLAPYSTGLAAPDMISAVMRERAMQALDDAAVSVRLTAPELAFDTSLRTGQPGQVLTEAARDASMLVVGARGVRGMAASLALGSVSRYAATHAPCAVVIHREPAGPPRHLVAVGVRRPDESEAALGFAFEEAARRGAHLVAVQAWYWLHPAGTHGAKPPRQVSSDALIGLSRLLEPWRHKYPRVECGEEIRHAHPGQALTALTADADLLVLGRHQSSMPGCTAILGSVTATVLEGARGPVAIVPGSIR